MPRYHVLTLTKDLGGFQAVVHPVLIEDDDGLLLFDAGYPGQVEAFQDAFARLGFSFADLRKIVVSHHDHDHVGSLGELKSRNGGLQVVSSRTEAPYISGEDTSLRLLQAERHNENLAGDDRIAGERFVEYLRTVATSPVDRLVDEGEHVAKDVRVVDTPGHTPGHISLLIEDQDTLLAGDALAVEEGRLVIANPQFTLDLPRAVETVRKLSSLRIDRIVCYHGGTIETGARGRLERLWESLR